MKLFEPPCRNTEICPPGKAVWNANGGFVSVLLTHLLSFSSSYLLLLLLLFFFTGCMYVRKKLYILGGVVCLLTDSRLMSDVLIRH